MCSRLSKKVSQKMDLKTYGLHRDHSPVFQLKNYSRIPKWLKISQEIKFN